MTAENSPTSEGGVEKQGYRNPFNGGIRMFFNGNETKERILQKLKRIIRFPIKLSPSDTDQTFERMVQDETEALWGPGSHND